MDVFTIQLSNWRAAVERGIRVVSATYKANHPIFAPKGQMVWDWKDGRISWEEYTRAYRALMNQSVREHQVEWDEFLLQHMTDRVAIGCYCPDDEHKHCHRHLLIPMLAKYAEYRGIPFTFFGELKPDPKPNST